MTLFGMHAIKNVARNEIIKFILRLSSYYSILKEKCRYFVVLSHYKTLSFKNI